MSLDLDAIRRRHDDQMRHYRAYDESEFSIAATEALEAGDTPALLAEVDRLGKQLDAARYAFDGLNAVLAADRPVTATELAPLFDALWPKWGGVAPTGGSTDGEVDRAE